MTSLAEKTSSFYVNPSTPPGIDGDRFVAIARAALQRWGFGYLGTTDRPPSPPATEGDGDRVNVIGFRSDMPQYVNGRRSWRGRQEGSPSPSSSACVDVPLETHRVSEAKQLETVSYRRDVISGRRALRVVKKRSFEVPVRRIEAQSVAARRCRASAGGPGFGYTVSVENDIALNGNLTWNTETRHPTEHEMDLRSTLLHELGHAAGLDHATVRCDGTTPMATYLEPGEWWRGLDDWRLEPCTAAKPVADPLGANEAPVPFAGLSGLTIRVNESVPRGYDRSRWIETAKRAIARMGGVYAGASSRAPTVNDGESTIAIGPAVTRIQWAGVPIRQSLLRPERQTCEAARGTTTVPVVKPRTIRSRVAGRLVKRRVGGRWITRRTRSGRSIRRRVGGRVVVRRSKGRLVRLRRDLVLQGPASFVDARCGTLAGDAIDEGVVGREIDVLVGEDADVQFETGPQRPVLGTRLDLETALLQGLAGALGHGQGKNPCDPATPFGPIEPGDWWRGSDDYRKDACRRQHASRSSRPAYRTAGLRMLEADIE